MTRLPMDDRDVHGFEGPEYELSRECAQPDCTDYGQDVHHIWRRSALGGPFNWVQLPDGSASGNLVRLCREHHRQVTENDAHLSFQDGTFFWVEILSEDTIAQAPLSFQPPWLIWEMENAQQPTPESLGIDTSKDGWLAEYEQQVGQFEIAGEKTEPVLENECPACHRPLPRPKIEGKPEKKRLRRTWSITVPADKRENGAETLDTLLEEARLEMDKAGLGYGEERSVRFFVLATALGLFVQHFRELINES